MNRPSIRGTSRWGLTLLASLGLASPALAQTRPASAEEPGAAPRALPTPAPAVEPAPTAPPTAAPADAPAALPEAAPAPALDATGATTTPASVTTPAAEPSEEDAVAAALAAQGSADVPTEEYKLSLYGFTDFTYTKHFNRSSTQLPYSTFAVGNFNLYLAAELGDNWRSLSEVRFMYLPDGNVPMTFAATAPTRQSTAVGDYADINRPVRWGGIMIQRAWLEHTFHPALTVRAGQFLSPYGIWNVDHGSPAIIGARRPYVVGEGLIPERQTGLEIWGTHGIDALTLGYHVTLSNGRGPIDTYQDLDNNKAIGGRLFAKLDSDFGTLTVGGSFYRGKYTDRKDEFATNAKGEFVVRHVPTLVYAELSLAADVKWEWEGLLVQAEAMRNDIAYDDGARLADPGLPGSPPGFVPDYKRWGTYGLAGYRTKFLGTMPFAGLEYYNLGHQSYFPKAAAFWGGLNVRPTPRVVLKAQYTYSWFPGLEGEFANEHYNALDLQASWSF